MPRRNSRQDAQRRAMRRHGRVRIIMRPACPWKACSPPLTESMRDDDNAVVRRERGGWRTALLSRTPVHPGERPSDLVRRCPRRSRCGSAVRRPMHASVVSRAWSRTPHAGWIGRAGARWRESRCRRRWTPPSRIAPIEACGMRRWTRRRCIPSEPSASVDRMHAVAMHALIAAPARRTIQGHASAHRVHGIPSLRSRACALRRPCVHAAGRRRAAQTDMVAPAPFLSLRDAGSRTALMHAPDDRVDHPSIRERCAALRFALMRCPTVPGALRCTPCGRRAARDPVRWGWSSSISSEDGYHLS